MCTHVCIFHVIYILLHHIIHHIRSYEIHNRYHIANISQQTSSSFSSKHWNEYGACACRAFRLHMHPCVWHFWSAV